MKVLSIGNFLNPSWDGSRPDEEHIAGALEELGHSVTRNQRESQWTTTYDYNSTLIAQWDGYGDISALPRPLVYWAFDYQADGQEWHERLIEQSDLYLSKRIADSKYPNWRWLSQDFAPSFLDEYPFERKKDIDVLFTGSFLPWAHERNETLKAVDEKFNLVIHSVNEWPGFKDVRPPVMDEGLPELYASAKVILSIDHTLEAGYWSDRNAQIMCCGGFVLCKYIPLMEARFQNNIEYFKNIEECLRKISFYLDCDEDRQNIAEIGYHYAQNNLKVIDRVADLMTIVENHV